MVSATGGAAVNPVAERIIGMARHVHTGEMTFSAFADLVRDLLKEQEEKAEPVPSRPESGIQRAGTG
jgi:hypothetical protein